MLVTEVRVSIRKSIGEDKEWRTIELGATAAVNGDDWQTVQNNLYRSMEAKLTILAAEPAQLPLPSPQAVESALRTAVRSTQNGTGGGSAPTGGQSTDKPAEAAPGRSTQLPAPICQKHGVPYQRYEKNGRSWWAHKAGDDWCNAKT